jgi:hypothetical protein
MAIGAVHSSSLFERPHNCMAEVFCADEVTLERQPSLSGATEWSAAQFA